MANRTYDYGRVRKIIRSCTTPEQLEVAKKYADLFVTLIKTNVDATDEFLLDINRREAEIKYKLSPGDKCIAIGNEEFPSIGTLIDYIPITQAKTFVPHVKYIDSEGACLSHLVPYTDELWNEIEIAKNNWTGTEKEFAHKYFWAVTVKAMKKKRMKEYEKWIGMEVEKHSPKPFKSGQKINTVKSIINHPILNIPAFTFFEDESYVECRKCKLVNDTIDSEKRISDLTYIINNYSEI